MMVHPDVDDDGYATIDGLPTAPFDQFLAQFHNYGEIEAYTTLFGGQTAVHGLFPNTISDIQMLSKSAVFRPASEGAYVVQSNSDDVNLFIQAPSINNEGGAANLIISLLTWYRPSTNTHYYFLLHTTQSNIGDTEPLASQDIPWTMHDWSYTMFQGLTVPTSPISTNNGLPYISVKTILGLEVQPRLFSSMRPFMRELPMPDEAALDLASILIRERPDCMPSAANDFGQIFSAIAEYAPKVVDWISKAFGGSKSSAPAPEKKSSGKWALGDAIDGAVNRAPVARAIAPRQQIQPRQNRTNKVRKPKPPKQRSRTAPLERGMQRMALAPRPKKRRPRVVPEPGPKRKFATLNERFQ
jgi:hypothetical protein